MKVTRIRSIVVVQQVNRLPSPLDLALVDLSTRVLEFFVFCVRFDFEKIITPKDTHQTDVGTFTFTEDRPLNKTPRELTRPALLLTSFFDLSM